MNYLIHKNPVAISAHGTEHFGTGLEDVAYVAAHFDNGFIAHFHCNWLSPVKIRRTLISGDRKMLVWDDLSSDEKIKIYDKGIDVPPYYDTFADFQFSYRYGDIHSPRIEDYEPLKKECDHFLACIEKGACPLSDGYSGLRVVSILEAASKSLKLSGKSVQIQGLKLISKKSKNNGNGYLMASSWR